MMLDGFGRAIDYMRISITDRCNLRCRYCMPEDIELVSMNKIMTYEEIIMITEVAAEIGIKKIKLTGGEPLVRKGCVDLVGKIKQIPGIEQVTMTTNGVILAQCLPDLLENGLDAVNISLDTLDREKFRQITGRDNFEQVILGIDAATEAARNSGFRVKINAVLQKGMNDMEWTDLILLAKDRPVDVRFIEMMPIGFGQEYAPVYNEEILQQLEQMYPGVEKDETVHGNGPAVYYHLPGYLGSVGFISAMHGKFCDHCNRIRLTSQGKVKPCLCFGETVDLMEAVRNPNPDEARRLTKEALLKAIGMKPQSHKFEELDEITELKKMVQIGG